MSDDLDFDVNVDYGSDNSGPTMEPAERPMSEPVEQTQAPADEYEFTARGKQIKANRDQVLKYAQQGYDYAQNMEAFNRQRQEFDTQFKSYREIDEYARQNPQWWEHVQAQYNNNFQQQTQPNQLPPELEPILGELNELKQFKESLLAEKQEAQRQKEDAALKDEIESIRKQYSNLDLNSLDESGKSLETKILEYALDNNIRSFKTAFRDFYHDKLLERAREEGKELAAKEMQRRTKMGLLGESSAPKKEIRPAVDHRNKSYDDLLSDALNELGI